MRIYHVLLCTVSAITLTGCAFGHHINYSGSSNFSKPATMEAVALGAQDERPYVVNGDKQTNFVGLMRSLYGIPYNVYTSSGEPLADEIGTLVAGALRKNGANVMQVKIPMGTSLEGRVALFQNTNSFRYHLIEIHEWKTDTYLNATLSYDVSLSVIDGRGSLLATKNTKGDDKLGSRPDRANLSTAVSSIFGGLINDPAIVSASVVEFSPIPSALEPRLASKVNTGGCSVDQILEMKKLELSEDRIRAACK